MRLLFSFITYFYNNTGERCVFFINQHIGKFGLLSILLLLFILSCSLLLNSHIVDCLRILHTFYVSTTKTYTVPLDLHIVYCFNIYKTFVIIKTNKPRLFAVFVFFYHIFFNDSGKRCVFVINQHIGNCDSSRILLLIFFLSCCLPADLNIMS